MISRRFRSVLALTIFVVLPFAAVQACGPEWEPDTFVRATIPDDVHIFATGQLGILQAGYDSNELAVAYRYLNGGKLSDKEREEYAPPQAPVRDWTKLTPDQIQAAREADEAKQPVNAWRKARAEYVTAAGVDPSTPALAQDYSISDYFYDPDEERCPKPAFVNATLTLNRRAGTWGKQSRWLLDWIHGQDAVFANCAGKTPVTPLTAPADSPALLRADRAYQMAAAAFYSGQLDEARAQFEAIAKDISSPWQPWGGYLAARALVRKAFANAPKTDPWSGDVAQYDRSLMREAQSALEVLLSEPSQALPREAIRAELNFVRIRTEPDQRAAEICAALAGPGADSHFGQDLSDLNYLLTKKIELKDSPPLLAWIHALRDPAGTQNVIATWQSSHALPWLVIAIMRADAGNPAAPALLAAAATVKPSTPAYDTVTFHRIRLLTAMHRDAEARAVLEQILPAFQHGVASSRLNAFLAERMAVATTFDEFLTYAPRHMLAAESAGASNVSWDCNLTSDAPSTGKNCPEGPMGLEFDADAATVLNRQMPMPLLMEAARSPRLPVNLREELVLTTWTRAVLLNDAASAAKLAPLLPESIGKMAGTGTGFPAVFALLHNPGLRPYVEPGVAHVVTYAYLDHFRNNWWCNDWYGQFAEDPWAAKATPPVGFLTEKQEAKASEEFDRLMALPCAPAYLGQRVLDYAKANPADPNVPEALALTVRATHYACLTWGKTSLNALPYSRPGEDANSNLNTAVSKAAFDLLHRHYPRSPWTAKTRYYY